MKISLQWLQEFVDFNIIEKEFFKDLIVGEIKEINKHPEADSLKILKLDIGKNEYQQVVCAGTNVQVGVKTPVILPGMTLPNGFTVKTVKMRGIESNGMCCGPDELRIPTENHAKEIMILNTQAKPGTLLLEVLEKGYSSQELKNLLTIHTAEIEGIEYQGKYLDYVVSGKCLEAKKIEGTDKLHVGIFDIGWKKIQIVYGSVYSIKVGDIVPVALNGAHLPKGEIKATEFLGVKSEGMLCGDDELGIEKNTWEGITRLPADTKLGKPLVELLGLMQSVIEVDNKSLTHRPDLWCHYGFARELSAILNKKLKPFKTKVEFPKTGEMVEFDIQAREVVRGSSFCIIDSVKIEESPQWIKSRLMATGIRPINNVVDITNYVMIEIGQPMHAYDCDLTGNKLVIRNAKAGEVLETIDHKKRILTQEDIIMANDQGPLLVIGVMGGANSEICNETTKVIFEAGCWDPTIVRKASQRIGLRTESSQRFEKSLHPKMCEIAIKRACEILLQICKSAKLVGPMTSQILWDPGEINLEVDPVKICSKIGVEISEDKMAEILKFLEFECQKTHGQLKIKVPFFRATKDISIEDDIVEEIARIYGYENIKPSLPQFPIKTPNDNYERIRTHQARRILSLGLGFNEAMNYSFYSQADFQNSLLAEKDHLKVENYLSLDQTHLRVSLIPNLLKSVFQNQKYQEEFKIFEIGRTYIETGEFMPKEEKNIGAIIANQSKNYKKEIFYEAKGAVEIFLRIFAVKGARIVSAKNPPTYAHPKKCAEIMIGKDNFGYVYCLNPVVKKNYELEGEVAAFELNLSKLAQLGESLAKYKPLPKYPGINIDVSVVIHKAKTIAEITEVIRKADKVLIKDIKLFDVYEDKNLGDDKKALAFSILLQAEDRTLTDEEMVRVQSQVFKDLENIGGVIRGK
ncbi:phenylalanine--tRNA ligase subunit beta [Candidatus Peregrinibacteria bacterium RIFOXYB2_FULL_33_20]|nr:MAG: phenylalanine--tRNA ligase subunit beta [Candidatus Peregrinibacteria bacterium RIFOXYB2_FULL_33_20]